MKVSELRNLLDRIPNQEAEVTFVGVATVVVKSSKEKAYVANISGRAKACPACVEMSCAYNVNATCEAFQEGTTPNNPGECRYYIED